MHEERLSPELGRLIDATKAAAGRVGSDRAGTEVVGLLMATGRVYAARADEVGPESLFGAVESVLALAHAEEDEEVLAAAVALAHDLPESAYPSPVVCRSLEEIDPELPVVIKRMGRWVVLPLSQVQSSV